MPVAVQMVLLVLFIAAVQLAFWVPFMRWLKKKSAKVLFELNDELAKSGEKILRGPESGLYRGATQVFPRVKGNAVVVLTDRRLIVRTLLGKGFEIPVGQLAGLREDKVFLASYRGGKLTAIVKTREGAEVGVMMRDHPAWMNALKALI